MLLERDDLDERTMDEILIIFCLAANHPAFSFDMRTQMSQILKELEKRQRKMKLLQTVHNHNNNDDTLDESTCLTHHVLSSSMHNSSTLSVHASRMIKKNCFLFF
jgi:ABC-type Mn2+/Zn2+ transport system ATPase subunit